MRRHNRRRSRRPTWARWNAQPWCACYEMCAGTSLWPPAVSDSLERSCTSGCASISSSVLPKSGRDVMGILAIAAMCAGMFAGAAIYVSAVEHPARLSCGTEIALREFGPSYRRATVMQALLAIVGSVMGLWSAWAGSDGRVALGAILLGAAVPFTLVAILPTNHRLLDPALDPRSREATQLLVRWGRLHAVRTALSSAAFLLFLVRLSSR